MVLGAGRKIRTRTLMEKCGWLYFRELIDYHSLLQMYKVINIGKPSNLRQQLNILPNKRIEIFPARLKISRRSYKWRTISVWNELPDYLLNLDKISMFKKGLRRHLIEGRTVVVQRRPPEPD